MESHVLIVEDEPDIVELIRFHLESAGFSVADARTGRDAMEAIRRRTPNLVLLDLMLPDVSGTELCRRIRAEPTTSRVPIIMVTARSGEIDRVVGFEVGADDYVTKPFSPRELVLRVEAVLRRRGPAPRPEAEDEHVLGPLTLVISRRLCQVEGDRVELTPLEFELLADLALRRGRAQTRQALLDRVWGEAATRRLGPRTVDTQVKRLREKLGPARDLIETVRGVGYRMVERAR